MATDKYKSVAEFLESLDDAKRLQVDQLRALILSVNPDLEERIKWNAPSYVLDGEDRITFNLVNKEGIVKLVLHMGATRKEDKKGTPIMNDVSGLIQWNSDIRGLLSFTEGESIAEKSEQLEAIFVAWLAIPSKA